VKSTVLIAALWTLAELCSAKGQVFTGFPPAVPPLTGQEQIPADTGASPPSEVIRLNSLAQFVTSFDPGQNWLIAGDAGQNLFQRGTAGPYITTGVQFGPDRWAYWSAGSTPVSVGQDLTAGVELPGFAVAYRMQRQVGAVGVDQVCVMQEISSQNSGALQGKVVELDFGVSLGSDFSGAGLTVMVVVGTGVNEGVGKLAFGVNGGGGGTSSWTGQTSIVAANFSPLLGVVAHPVVVGLIPTATEEVGVGVCYVPSGTAGANDFVDLSGLQLRIAPAMVSYASGSVVYDASQVVTPSFTWRLGNQEAFLQYAYYWRLNEGPGLDVVGGNCTSSTALRADCFLQFPVLMNQVPTMSYHVGFATDANSGGQEVCTGLASTPGMVGTVRGITVGCSAGSNVKAATFLYENGGAGVISADAEWY
jgi:hypothetical protein